MSSERDPEGTEAKYLYELADFNHARVLEIGCGSGRLTWGYANSAKRVVAIDSDDEDLTEVHSDRPPGVTTPVSFAQVDAEALPFPQRTFDLAILAWSL
ncbi:MAG: class I SAM-dependent methyltransferase [Candidatus Neomarinimicrobiota bacterium]